MNSVCFTTSPLVRYALLAFYLALTLPLPFLLAQQRGWLWVSGLTLALGLGSWVVVGILEQRVEIDPDGIRVCHPQWIEAVQRRNWQVKWSEVRQISFSSTSQGGLAYYLLTESGERWLLPMRVGRFRHLLGLVQTYTGLDTQSVYPYVQPWMYLMVAGLSGLLLLWDIFWITMVVVSHPLPLLGLGSPPLLG
ncbi:MAG: hypothetical protein NW237_03365 [Cyanobacteriota bacterium]|nr:hypothetical protein [Cyanobacteriota bacterium]